MKMNEVLLIKLDTNGFECFYNRKMQECGCTVLPISDFRREKYGLSVLRPLQLRQLTPRYLAQYRLIVLFEEPALFLYLKKTDRPEPDKAGALELEYHQSHMAARKCSAAPPLRKLDV